MRIRSITYFFDPAQTSQFDPLINICEHRDSLKATLKIKGYEIQSVRLATTPFPTWLNLQDSTKALQQIKDLCDQAHSAGFDYLSLGPFHTADCDAVNLIPAILSISKDLFVTMRLDDVKGNISIPDIRACAEVIKRVAEVEPDGFANLRFAALANVKPFTPFFPAAYGASGELAFSIAMECADMATEIFQKTRNIDSGCQELQTVFFEHANRIEEGTAHISPSIPFKGFDFSLAPYPEDWCSFGKALESLGVAQIGSAGSIAASAILAGALDGGTWKKAGFNGLMMPILEDSILAERSSAGVLSIYDVLQYSSVCGTGLDTVPLPGDIETEKLEALLLDVAALALRLNKPLTARLMPIPNKKAGDKTDFDFSYFAKGSVLDYPFSGIQPPLTVGETIKIRPRFR